MDFGNFKAPQRKQIKPSSGSNQGLGALLGFQLGQMKSQQAKEDLPEGATPVSGTINGVKYTSPLADIKVRESLRNVKFQKENFKTMRSSISSVPQGRVKGGISMLKSYISGGKGDEGSNSLFYLHNKPAMAVALYRDLTGDTRTSDADAEKRALGLLPDQMEHPDLINKKIGNIEDSLSMREQLLSTGSFQVSDNGDILTNEPFSRAIRGASRVKVRNKVTGATGTISPEAFDPNKYERI